MNEIEIKRFKIHTNSIKTINLPFSFIEDNNPQRGDLIKIFRPIEGNRLVIEIVKAG